MQSSFGSYEQLKRLSERVEIELYEEFLSSYHAYH